MRKKLLITAVILAALATAFVVLLLNLGGLANRNKDFLIARAEGALGRKITVGKIGVTIRGGLGVRLQDFAIADDPGFSSEPFIRAADLQVNARLLPLLRKQFEVKRVILREPVIRIIRNAEGLLNVAARPGGDGGATGISAPSSASQPAVLVISLVNLDGGELHYIDQTQGLELRVTDMQSRVEDIDLDNPITLELAAAFLSDARNVTVRATVGPAGDDPWKTPMDATVTLDPFELGRGVDTFPQLAASLPEGFEITGPVKLTASVSGTPAEPEVVIALDATTATLRGPQGFHKAEGVPLTIDSGLKTGAASVEIADLELVFNNLKVTGQGEVATGEAPSVKLDLASQPTDLAGWSSILPAMEPYELGGNVQFAAAVRGPLGGEKPPGVSGTAKIRGGSAKLPQQPKPLREIQADATFTERGAEIMNASLKIGGSRIDAEATVVSFDPLTVDYRASSPSLALLDVKPPNPAAKKPEAMETLVVQGRMRAGRTVINRGKLSSTGGSVANFDYENLTGKYSAEGNAIDLSDVSVQTLDGSLNGKGRILMDEQSPSFNFESEARDLNLVQVFEVIPGGVRKHLRGRANLNVKISGKGKDWNNIQKTVDGDGFANFFAGEIVGTNIFNKIVDQLSSITGNPDWVAQNVRDKYPKVFKNADTAFKDFSSTFVIEGGKLLARNVKLDAGDYSMLGKGALDFGGGLDLNITLTVSKGLSADLVSGFSAASLLLDTQGRIQIPFLLTGTLPGVKAKPDPDFVKKVLEKALVNKGLDLFGKKGSDLEELKKDGLKKFLDFGKKKKKPAAPADTTTAP
ncbi:MAG: AsmA-like C-terminal region-containing protein [Candidatus Krumholzibacteriia bacterium]